MPLNAPWSWLGKKDKAPSPEAEQPIMGGPELVGALKEGKIPVFEEYFASSTGTDEEIATQLAVFLRMEAPHDVDAVREKLTDAMEWVSNKTKEQIRSLVTELKKEAH